MEKYWKSPGILSVRKSGNHACMKYSHLVIISKVISQKSWSNLSVQSLQPSYTDTQFEENNNEQEMSCYMDDGFIGGSCLRLCGKFTTKPLLFR